MSPTKWNGEVECQGCVLNLHFMVEMLELPLYYKLWVMLEFVLLFV